MPTTTLNIDGLVNIVAAEHNITKALARSIIRSVIANTASAISALDSDGNSRVQLHGLGTFRVVRRRAPTTKPSKGESPEMGEFLNVRFRPAQSLKNELAD